MRNGKLFRHVLTALFAALTAAAGIDPAGVDSVGTDQSNDPAYPGDHLVRLCSGSAPGWMLGLCFGMASTLAAFGISLGRGTIRPGAACGDGKPAAGHCDVHAAAPDDSRDDVWGLPGRQAAFLVLRRAWRVRPSWGRLTNTVLYLGAMFLLFVTLDLDVQRWVNAILTGTALAGAFGEAPVAAILAVPVTAALFKQTQKKR